MVDSSVERRAICSNGDGKIRRDAMDRKKEALETMSAAKAAGAIAKRFGLERNAVYARATELKAK